MSDTDPIEGFIQALLNATTAGVDEDNVPTLALGDVINDFGDPVTGLNFMVMLRRGLPIPYTFFGRLAAFGINIPDDMRVQMMAGTYAGPNNNPNVRENNSGGSTSQTTTSAGTVIPAQYLKAPPGQSPSWWHKHVLSAYERRDAQEERAAAKLKDWERKARQVQEDQAKYEEQGTKTAPKQEQVKAKEDEVMADMDEGKVATDERGEDGEHGEGAVDENLQDEGFMDEDDGLCEEDRRQERPEHDLDLGSGDSSDSDFSDSDDDDSDSSPSDDGE